MGLTKFASFEVSEILDVKGSRDKKRTASLDRLSDYHDYRTEDGYLYARIRAISSRVNKNHDGWPSVELAGGKDAWTEFTSKHEASTGFTVEADTQKKYGYSTFVGKPIFVDHNNSDPTRSRGAIVDAKLHVEDAKTASELDPYYADAPENHTPPTWVELLLEIDAKSFPKFAKAIIEGSQDADKGIDGFSMGCDVEESRCSICDKRASSPDEYCDHVRMKGATFKDKTGKQKKSYEDCYGIKFFEISGVFDPADETALVREVINEKPQRTHDSAVYHQTVEAMTTKLADNPPPQSELTKAPEKVDTLRKEQICPVCGSDMDSEKCDVCGYIEPPEGFGNPDLTKAQGEQEPLPGDSSDLGEVEEVPQQPLPEGQPPAPGSTDAVSYLQARKPNVTSHVMNEMAWSPTLTPKVAARINPNESPIKPPASGGSNEPATEVVVNDQTTPVTSRTADAIVAGTERNQETSMSDQVARVAAEPADPSGKPKKRVDTEGVGGVDEATNENASRADKQVDVEGKGATGPEESNAEATKPDENDNLPTAGRDSDDSGFNKDKTVTDSGKTKTFDNSNEPGSAVTQKAWPTSHVEAGGKGAQPGDPVFKPDERVDVAKDGPTPSPIPGTDQWTGTGGNGVTRQQEPVTKKVDPNITVSNTKLFAAFRLADAEIELDLVPKDEKYDRVAELSEQSLEEIQASLTSLAKVKTAGLRKQTTTTKVAHRVPSLQRTASSEAVPVTDDSVLDSALFGR